MLDNQERVAGNLFVPLTADQLQEARDTIEQA
jgi:hypothetical protein